MDGDSPAEQWSDGGVDRLIASVRTSTGVKMFLILTLALLPLGLIALFASLQAIRTADQEKTTLLNLAVTQSARKLSSEINSDRAGLALLANNMSTAMDERNFCARAFEYLRARGSERVQFVLLGRTGARHCGGSRLPANALPDPDQIARLVPDDGLLVIRSPSDDGEMAAFAIYDRAHLQSISRAVSMLHGHRIELAQGRARLTVSDTLPTDDSNALESAAARIDPTDIGLHVTIIDPPITAVRALSLFLPLLMWFAAAAVGWFVVNRLLIRPLIQLRRLVATYKPGEVLEVGRRIRTPAHEIRDLADTFRLISQDVSTHEAEMAEALARQRRLTREVHHRVKNNLQIIASLINLHSRTASAEAASAYGSIQRRVDALSVVHRNHYAELEENRGLSIRALISELSASLRSSAPDEARGFVIQVNSDDLFVTQDVAVPIAFLITELVELAMLIDPRATVRISVTAKNPAQAELALESPAYRPSAAMASQIIRFDRVLTGLSRQLRAPLNHDEAERYTIIVSATA